MLSRACAALSIGAGDSMSLNCTLSDAAAGAAIRSASGVVGIYLSSGRGRYLGKAEAEAIGRVVTGVGSPFFRAIEADPKLFITFVLTNRCEVPVDYSVLYRAMDAAESGAFTEVSGRVDAGESRFVDLMTDNGVVYMRGTAGNGAFVWEGGRVFEGGRYFNIRINGWGDYFHALNCNRG
nr:hypothetical protein [Marinicella sp. W31]MDC2879819.1 hypothetical protein [Marinicella sp. W31]